MNEYVVNTVPALGLNEAFLVGLLTNIITFEYTIQKAAK